MPETTTYKVGEDIYDIPQNEVETFLKDNPKAQKTQSYTIGSDTFDIPENEVPQFLKDVPSAKPLKKKDDSQISSKDSPTQEVSSQPSRLKFDTRTVGEKQTPIQGGLMDAVKPDLISAEDREAITLKNKDILKGRKKLDPFSNINSGVIQNDLPNFFNGDKYADYEYALTQESKRKGYRNTLIGINDIEEGGTLKKMAWGFGQGMASLPKGVLNGIEYLWDMYSMADVKDAMFKDFGVEKPKDTFDKIKDSDWYKEYENSLAAYSETLNKESLTDQWKGGDRKGAIETALIGASQSLPLTLAALIGGSGGLGVIGLMSAGTKYDSLEDSDMPIANRLLNSTITGSLEILTESVTQGYGKALTGIFGREGKKVGKEVIEKGIKSWMKQPLQRLGIYTAPLGEALSEGINGWSQYMTDVSFGIQEYDPEEAKRQFIDNAAVGLPMGSAFTIVGATGKLIKPSSKLVKENDNIKTSLIDQVQKPIDEKELYLDKLLKDVPENYKETARKDITELLIKKDELQFKHDKASEKLKPVFDKQIKAVDNAIADVVNIEEEFEQDTEKKGDQLKASEARSPKKGTKTPPKEKVTVTPPEEVKIGNAVLKGEDLDAYNELSDKYGEEKAKEMILPLLGETPEANPWSDKTATEANERILRQKEASSLQETKPNEPIQTETTEPLSETQSLQEPITQEVTQNENEPKTITPSTEEVRIDQQQESQQADMGKASFKFLGEQRIGTITEKGKGFVKIKDDIGTIHTVRDKSATYSDLQTDPIKVKAVEDSILADRDAFEREIKSKLEKDKEKPSQQGFLSGTPLQSLNKRAKIKPLKSAGQIWREQTSPSKGMPKRVHEAAIVAEGKVRQARYNLGNYVNDQYKKIKDAYGAKLSEGEMSQIQKALESVGPTKETQDIAFETIVRSLPDEAKQVVTDMRRWIDQYSDAIKELDMIGVVMEEKVDKNRGYYVTRTYKKHTDRNWTWETVPDEIKEEAAKVIKDLYPKYTPDEVLGTLRSMLETSDISDFVIKKGQSLGDIDKSVLKRRSQFLTDNPEIRAFLGENNDPFYNFAVSVSKMAEIAERGKLLENIRDIGLEDGWLSEKPSNEKSLIKQIVYNKGSYAGKQGIKQLDEYYTTPEIADAISKFFDKPKMGDGVRVWMTAITAVKISKTAGSVKGVIRNFKSNITNAVANANWNFKDTGVEMAKRLGDKRGFFSEMYGRGIIGDSSNAGELIRNVQELSSKLTEIDSLNENAFQKSKRKTIKAVLDTYQLADDVWKAYRYVSEYTRYHKAYLKKGIPEDTAINAAKDSAAKILHSTSTYWSQLPRFIQSFRKLPIANTFISFPYLTLSNYIGTIKIAMNEMKDPQLVHIGIQRMAGSIAAVSALALLAGYENKKHGITDKKLQQLRRFLPEFWKNDIISVKKVNKDATYEYSNTSYLDYYNVITTPVLMLERQFSSNGEITSEDIKEAAIEFSKSFIGWDILFDRVTNLKANVDPATGMSIYNTADEKDRQFRNMASYLWNAVEPGTLTDARRIYKTSREGGEWERQLVGTLTGSQNRTIDPLRSLSSFMLYRYKDQLDNARKIYKDELRRYNKLEEPNESDKKALKGAKERAEGALNRIIDEVKLDYDAANNLGVSVGQLNEAIKGIKFDKDITDAILKRGAVKLNDKGEIEK
jgi:hypothetical protein